ncbi:MAG: hydroxymethylpyrimidine kinase/phosphomethylpyrimidine kinase/thiamine-phosphate diphosphorylase [Pseudohongiellaceae bacterium]|jgi:hydroxymethylpyrimidine kinase/phosphomethylpyrimidine kinase/thiamine-phosphate diphosphorylase
MSRPLKQNNVCCFSASDSSGHAGLQADLRTLCKLDIHGSSVVTAITAQNSQRLSQLSPTSINDLFAQWQSLIEDSPPSVCKIGLLANNNQVNAITDLVTASNCLWIADPVLQSSTGFEFHGQSVREAYKKLLPHLDLITPNIPETEIILDRILRHSQDIEWAAKELHRLGAKAVLIKGGHSQNKKRSQDFFYSSTKQFWLSSSKQHVGNSRGTGCVMASAIAAFICHGKNMHDAVVLAHAYVQQGLKNGYTIGKGSGPIAAGHWPGQLTDYPEVSDQADFSPPQAFARCDTQSLGLYPVIESIDWLEKLLIEGVGTLQLRAKQITGPILSDTIRQAVQLSSRYNARLFINDHWQLAIQHGAYGVHLGQEDINTADIDALRKAGVRLGISTHSEYEWARAHTLRPSYIALGAVFPTQTKPAQVIGIDNLKCWASLLQQQYPVTAIGGINLKNIDQVLATGIGSIALVTAITESSDYRSTTLQLLQKFT